jgi:hypothetical protein
MTDRQAEIDELHLILMGLAVLLFILILSRNS